MSNRGVSQTLRELNEKAKLIQSDPNLRHMPSVHDLQEASQNARLMQAYQQQTITQEGDESIEL